MLRLRCSINCLNSSPDALRGTLGRRKGTEVSPESVARHPWAAERGGSVTGECRVAPLGNGKGRKCHRRVSRGTLGQRKGTEVSPESVARHPWATERDGSAAGECRVAPLGNGKGRKCRRRVSRGTLGQRKGTEVSPGSVARHPWAAERGGSVAGECRAVTELAEVAIFAGMVAVILRQMMANLPNCHIRGNGITFDNTPCVRLRERRRRKKNAALRIWLGKRKNDAQIR